MRCPSCKNKVLQKSGNTVRIRTHGPVEFTAEGCKTKCHWCKSDVSLPLQIEPGTEIPSERFVLKKGTV